MAVATRFNPFPGLRPFEMGEEHLFFGREGQSEEILRRLRQNRFLAVVGTSGSGKSSLIRAGLLPYLHGGFMAGAGSHWRVAIFRPGSDPVGNLARALNDPAVLGAPVAKEEDAARNAVLLEVTLRRSGLGLIEAVRLARLPDQDNVLVIVDQFEELFRFADAARSLWREEDAPAFVRLLLETARQRTLPVYVVLTMRSDFIGDCARFRDLPETVTEGLYLIPRMTREQLRSAIEGPVRVGSTEISRRLVTRLLNDVGDDIDELPTLQHALMRTWDYWEAHHSDGQSIDLEHYLAIGGMSEALSRHAEEAYQELPSDRLREIAKRLFQSLTEKGPDNRELRRPTAVADIATAAGAGVAEVIAVVESFRRPGRSFLTPPPSVPLDKDSVIDISHESLIRGWQRLKGWVDEESESAKVYRRLAETAALHAQGKAGLWDDPDLQNALAWREREKPTATWAKRYHAGFEQAIAFLDKSREARETAVMEMERHRERELRRRRTNLAVVGGVLAVAVVLAIAAGQQKQQAEVNARNMEREHVLRENAVQAQQQAEKARQDAERQRQVAVQAQQQAVQAQQQAEKSRQDAERQREVAVQQRRIAERQRQLAEENARKAHDAEERATRSAADADRQAHLATAGRLASGAALESTDQFDLALLLALESRRINDNPETRSSLLHVLSANPRITVFLRRHTGNVLSVAFNPDGTLLASGSSDKTIRLWSVSTAQSLRSLTGHTDAVWDVAFSPDGKMLASGSSDKTVRLWDVATGQVLRSFTGHTGEVLSVAFNPDGTLLASGSSDKTIRLWDVATGQVLRSFTGHTDKVWGVAFSPDGTLLASGSSDKTIRLWDVATGQPWRSLTGHTRTVWSVAFTRDGKLVSGSADKTIRLWDAATGQVLRSLTGHTGMVLFVAVSPDGTRLASGGSDSTVRLWDVATGQVLRSFTGHTDDVESVAFSPDGKRLASGSVDRTVIVWDMTARQRMARSLTGHTGTVWSVAFTRDGKLVSGSADKTIRLWDAATGQVLRSLTGHTGMVLFVAVSPDGKRLASGSSDKTVRLWDVATGQVLRSFTGHTDNVESVAFSPDGTLLASGSSDKTIRLWDMATGQVLRSFIGHTGEVLSVAFNPDGTLLASGSSDKTIRLWDVSSGRQMRSLTGHSDEVDSVAFSPDGRLLASGGLDAKVILWDVETGKQLRARTNQPAATVAFSPADGTLLASAGKDGTIVLWDVSLDPSSHRPKLLPLVTLANAHTDKVWSVVFNRDGTMLASGGRDKTIFLWDLNYASWEWRACRIANRNLSPDEWNQWVGPTIPYMHICPP